MQVVKSREITIIKKLEQELEWYDKAVIHSYKEYSKSILKLVVDHSKASNALMFHSLCIAYINPKGKALLIN